MMIVGDPISPNSIQMAGDRHGLVIGGWWLNLDAIFWNEIMADDDEKRMMVDARPTNGGW